MLKRNSKKNDKSFVSLEEQKVQKSNLIPYLFIIQKHIIILKVIIIDPGAVPTK